MIPKHTPAPWRVIDRGSKAPGGQLARFWIGAWPNGSHEVCAVACHQNGPVPQPNDDEAEANARLIAAAPELKIACEGALVALRLGVHVDKAQVIEYIEELLVRIEGSGG